MRYPALVVLLCFSLLHGDALARDAVSREWERVPEDKRLHADVSARIGLLFSGFIYALPRRGVDRNGKPARLSEATRIASAAGICLAPGLGKEAVDEIEYRSTERRTSGADPMDLVADVAGCAVGIGAGAAVGTGLRYVVVQPVLRADGGFAFTAGVRF